MEKCKNHIKKRVEKCEDLNMLERKAYKKIDEWYKSSTSALLVDGARSVGKTTLIEEYLKKEKIPYVEFNLIKQTNVLNSINLCNDSKQLFLRLTSFADKPLIDDRTIIFIDEIQEADDALTAIKWLSENNHYRYIISGSLLGIKLKDIRSFPVSYMSIINMHPLSFEEFILANSVNPKIIDYLRTSFKNLTPIDEEIHKSMMELFNLYLLVGGMPEVVDTYLKFNNLQKINFILNKIDTGYLADIAKYDPDEKLLLEDIYNLIPSELNSHNKRFILKSLNENKRFYNYESSFVWLRYSGVSLFVNNVDNPVYPLLASKKRTLFKLFYCDVGLLSYKLFDGNQTALLQSNLNINYGMLYEQAVAQELTFQGFNIFYNNDKKRGEIDFLIELNNKVIPIEVKSGKDYKRHSALSNMMANPFFNYEKAYVLTNQNISKKDNIIYIPVYMCMFIRKEKATGSIPSIDISKLK